MEDRESNAGGHSPTAIAIDKPVTTLAIVDRCYRVVKANGALSGARACAATWRASRQGVVPCIRKGQSSAADALDLQKPAPDAAIKIVEPKK